MPSRPPSNRGGEVLSHATDLTLKTAYWGDSQARSAFKQFILGIHGLDFGAWETAGYWDDAYTPFSFFDGETVVASVCIYLLDAVVDGHPTRLVQISGVGTLPQWRRRGLNRELTEIGLDWARDKYTGLFLFADTDAIPFYERCGFRPLDEFVESVKVPSVPHRGGAVRLDCEDRDDLDRIYELARRRAPVSNSFSVLNAKLVMFHVLYRLRNSVYEIPELGCIVFLQRHNGCLKLLDVLGERIPSLEELYPYIARESDRFIEFHFHADRLGLDDTSRRTRPLLGNNCFVRGAFPVDRPVFPYTSRA